MNVEALRQYCLSKKGAGEEFPFDQETLVFKVLGKMFALVSLETVPLQVSLKCDPARALVLREEYDGLITGAYHMNKKHWNSLQVESLPPVLVEELIDHSYELVVNGLTRRQQQELKNLEA